MKKRLTAFALALALAFGVCAPAARAAEDAAAEEPEKLAFEDLRGRMAENCYSLRILDESIRMLEELDYDKTKDDLREALNALAMGQWTMLQYPMFFNQKQYDTLEQSYTAMEKQYEAIRKGDLQKDNANAIRQLKNAQELTVSAAESLFIALKGLEASDADLTRTMAKMDRTVTELELRGSLGQVSELAVNQARSGRTQAASGQETLRMNIAVTLLQLGAMVGADPDAAPALGELPAVTAEQLAAMDLAADLARAKEASYELFDAKKTYDDARKAYYDKGWNNGVQQTYAAKQAEHTFNSAQFTYENTVQGFELKFRTLYAQVKDAAQILNAKRDALATAEQEYAASELKHRQGAISTNALADAGDTLADARSAVAAAERELFSRWRGYWWAVEYGILN